MNFGSCALSDILKEKEFLFVLYSAIPFWFGKLKSVIPKLNSSPYKNSFSSFSLKISIFISELIFFSDLLLVNLSE